MPNNQPTAPSPRTHTPEPRIIDNPPARKTVAQAVANAKAQLKEGEVTADGTQEDLCGCFTNHPPQDLTVAAAATAHAATTARRWRGGEHDEGQPRSVATTRVPRTTQAGDRSPSLLRRLRHNRRPDRRPHGPALAGRRPQRPSSCAAAPATPGRAPLASKKRHDPIPRFRQENVATLGRVRRWPRTPEELIGLRLEV